MTDTIDLVDDGNGNFIPASGGGGAGGNGSGNNAGGSTPAPGPGLPWLLWQVLLSLWNALMLFFGYGNQVRQRADNWWVGITSLWVVLPALGLVTFLWSVNFYGGWGGMLFNAFFLIINSLVLKIVLNLPTFWGIVTLGGLLNRDVNQAYRFYGMNVQPTFFFWYQFLVGLLATFPFHWGHWSLFWFGLAISYFLVTWQWKWVSEAQWIKSLSLAYAVCVLIVIAFMIVTAPVRSWYNSWANPPSAFNAETAAVQWSMDPVSGDVFKQFSPEECQARRLGYCINEDTGQRLVPYDATVVLQIKQRNYVPPQTSMGALVFGGNSVVTAPPAPTCTGLNCQVRMVQPGQEIQIVFKGDGSKRQLEMLYKPGIQMVTRDLVEDGNVYGKIFTYTGNFPQEYTFWERPL